MKTFKVNQILDLLPEEIWKDEKLCKKYGLSKDEIVFIESIIRPMEASDE